jgi:hypothetical protein
MTFLSLTTCGQPRSAQSLTVRHLMKAVYAMVRPAIVQNGATNRGPSQLAHGLPVLRREDVPVDIARCRDRQDRERNLR